MATASGKGSRQVEAGNSRGASQPAVASGGAAQPALQELVDEIIQLGHMPTHPARCASVEEKRLARRLIRAGKAGSLTREQEAALGNLAQASGASQPASLRRQAVPEEQACWLGNPAGQQQRGVAGFCIRLSSLTDSALEELAIAVEEEQFLRTRRRMASAASAGSQTNQAPELQAGAVPTPGSPELAIPFAVTRSASCTDGAALVLEGQRPAAAGGSTATWEAAQ